jgi:hypothetical protein
MRAFEDVLMMHRIACVWTCAHDVRQVLCIRGHAIRPLRPVPASGEETPHTEHPRKRHTDIISGRRQHHESVHFGVGSNPVALLSASRRPARGKRWGEDPSRAAIGGARVSVMNQRTGFAHAILTSQQGLYSFPSLPPGEYSVTVEAQGFRKTELSGLVLNVSTTTTIPFRLELGPTQETVSVVAKQDMVQVADPQAGCLKNRGNSNQLYGNRRVESDADVTNNRNFSYPGYNETLTGIADPRIDSNDKKLNPNITVVEWLHNRPAYRGKLAAFAA